MTKRPMRKFTKRKCESVEDPHELLLSLVDLGSLDTEEALLVCVAEMSDAECKRVLNSLSLPAQTEDVEDEVEDTYMVEVPDEESDDEDVEEVEDEEADEESDSDEESEDEDIEAELEARIRRLEKCVKREEEDDEECEECSSRRRTESRKRRKLEGVDGFRPDVEEWFWENYGEDSFDDEDERIEELQRISEIRPPARDEDNDPVVDDCIEAMVDEYGYDEDGINRRVRTITLIISNLAKEALS